MTELQHVRLQSASSTSSASSQSSLSQSSSSQAMNQSQSSSSEAPNTSASEVERILGLSSPYHFSPKELEQRLEQLAEILQSPYVFCHRCFTSAVSTFSGSSWCMAGSDFKIPDLTNDISCGGSSTSKSRPQAFFKRLSVTLIQEMKHKIGLRGFDTKEFGNVIYDGEGSHEGFTKAIIDNKGFMHVTCDELGCYYDMLGCQASKTQGGIPTSGVTKALRLWDGAGIDRVLVNKESSHSIPSTTVGTSLAGQGPAVKKLFEGLWAIGFGPRFGVYHAYAFSQRYSLIFVKTYSLIFVMQSFDLFC